MVTKARARKKTTKKPFSQAMYDKLVTIRARAILSHRKTQQGLRDAQRKLSDYTKSHK